MADEKEVTGAFGEAPAVKAKPEKKPAKASKSDTDKKIEDLERMVRDLTAWKETRQQLPMSFDEREAAVSKERDRMLTMKKGKFKQQFVLAEEEKGQKRSRIRVLNRVWGDSKDQVHSRLTRSTSDTNRISGGLARTSSQPFSIKVMTEEEYTVRKAEIAAAK